MKVYVARHAQAEHNLIDIFHDATVPADVPLTNLGIEQAEGLARKLADRQIDVMYVSELRRTLQTAQIVNRLHDAPIIQNPLLNDIVSGIAGRPVIEFRQMIYASPDPWNAKFEGGESFEDEKKRMIKFLDFLRTQENENVFIVTSGGLANIIYGIVHGLSNDDTFNRAIPNVEVFEFVL